MRLYYIDESEGPRYYVRTALGVDAERWNDLHQRVLDWRLELRERYAVPIDRELHACDLLAGRGKLAHQGSADYRLTPEQGAEIFTGGLRVIEDAARTIAASRSSTSACASPTSRATSGPASTGCSTASTPPSRRRAATLSSSSTRAARR